MSLSPDAHALSIESSEKASQPISQPDPLSKHEDNINTSSISSLNQINSTDKTPIMTTRKSILEKWEPPMPVSAYRQSSNGSPTISTTRVRWQRLAEWRTLMTEVMEYIRNLSPEELRARVASADYRSSANEELEETAEATDESTLRPWIKSIFFFPHNVASRPVAAVNAHAKIFEASAARYPQAGKCDYLFVHNNTICGVVELKTFWKVTPAQIDEVISGRVPVSGYHAGRLAIEQTYGYMVHNKHRIGVMTTMNGWVFLHRTEFGELFISRMIPCDARNPYQCTVFQILYYISALAAQSSELPELYGNGQVATIPSADGSRPVAAPMAPGRGSLPPPPSTDDHSSGKTEYLPSIPPFRRHVLEPWTNAPEVIFEPWREGNTLGAKTFLLTLVPDETVVVAKMWDGYKELPNERDNEVSIYLRLSSLWNTVVPRLIGSAQIDFFISLLIERIEGKQLCAANLDDEVSKNVKDAFAQIHALGVIHGDVRRQNIMVREDKSVVIIDFESGVYHENLSDVMIKEENDEIERVFKEVRHEGSSGLRAKGQDH